MHIWSADLAGEAALTPEQRAEQDRQRELLRKIGFPTGRERLALAIFATGAYKLPVIGTASILVTAKRAGLIGAVRPLLEAMVTRGYHLSQRLIEEATAIAGEASGSTD